MARIGWSVRLGCAAVALLMPLTFAQADGSLLQPLAGEGWMPGAPWRVVGLPRQRKPFTQFSLVDIDGRRALRVDAEDAYGNLVHALDPQPPALHLDWQWRVDQFIEAADLRRRATDDSPIKVCVFFDLPLSSVPFVERQLLRLARSTSGEALPAATVCYVWDQHLPRGTALDNAYTRRLRYLVLESGSERMHQWMHERRDVAADFHRLFGDESDQPVPVIGVAIGADADNTHGHSVAHVVDLLLVP